MLFRSNFQWAKDYSHTTRDTIADGVAIDSLGNVYVAGYEDSSTEGDGNLDFLTLKYTSSGTLVWARTYTEGQEEKANAIAKNSVMIGDNLEADIIGALNCGISSIHFTEEKHTFENKKYTSVSQLLQIKQYL